ELARRFPLRMPLKPLSVPGRPRLEMRWHLDANGRLICTWLRVAGATPVRLSDEDAKPPSWHTLVCRAAAPCACRVRGSGLSEVAPRLRPCALEALGCEAHAWSLTDANRNRQRANPSSVIVA